MPYRVSLLPAASRALKKLPRKAASRVARAIDTLEEAPRPSGARKLQGDSGLLRIRVGTYRVLYRVRDAEREVVVTRIAHRREVYR